MRASTRWFSSAARYIRVKRRLPYYFKYGALRFVRLSSQYCRVNSLVLAQKRICDGNQRSYLFRKNAFFALRSKRGGFEAMSRQSREVVVALRRAGSQMLRDAMLAFSLHNCEMIAANQPVADKTARYRVLSLGLVTRKPKAWRSFCLRIHRSFRYLYLFTALNGSDL